MIIDDYFTAKAALFASFDYFEDWHLYPVTDERNMWWAVLDDAVVSAHDRETVRRVLADGDVLEDYWSSPIMRDGFLPCSIWRHAGFTMVLVDTQCDGNRVLEIYDDAKRVEEEGEALP